MDSFYGKLELEFIFNAFNWNNNEESLIYNALEKWILYFTKNMKVISPSLLHVIC
jgi:hypothetical protein